MQKLSGAHLTIMKCVFPLFTLVFISIGLTMLLSSPEKMFSLIFLCFVLFISVATLFDAFVRYHEAWIADDRLVFRQRGDEKVVLLCDVTAVSFKRFTKGCPIVVKTSSGGTFQFFPPWALPFTEPEEVRTLRVRVDEARRAAQSR